MLIGSEAYIIHMRGGGAAAAVRALRWVKKGRKRGCFLRSREALAEKWQRHKELVQWQARSEG